MSDKDVLKKKKELLEIVERFQSLHAMATDENIDRDKFISGIFDEGEKVAGSYNQASEEIMLCFEVQGTQYEGRSPRIENVELGTPVVVVREKDNQYDTNALGILNSMNESLGHAPADISGALSPLIDENMAEITEAHVSYVEPLSKRSNLAKKAILYVEIIVKLADIIGELEDEHKAVRLDSEMEDRCIVCLLGGDQVHGWFQKLRILTCDIPLSDAKLLFELDNRRSEVC